MFFSAALNLIVALNFSVVTWASFMSVYGIVSKFGLFLLQYATMRYIGVRRRRTMPNLQREGLTGHVKNRTNGPLRRGKTVKIGT